MRKLKVVKKQHFSVLPTVSGCSLGPHMDHHYAARFVKLEDWKVAWIVGQQDVRLVLDRH